MKLSSLLNPVYVEINSSAGGSVEKTAILLIWGIWYIFPMLLP